MKGGRPIDKEKAKEVRFKRTTFKTLLLISDSLQKQRDVLKYHAESIQELDKKLSATRRLLAAVCSLVSVTLLVQLVHLWLLLSR